MMEDREKDPSIPECVDLLRRTSRSDWIAFAAGALTFPLGFWSHLWLSSPNPPVLIANIVLAALAFAAAAIPASRNRSTDVPLRLVPASSIRWGARTGLIVFLVGGGFCLLGISARQLVDGIASGSLSMKSLGNGVGIGLILTMLPTIAAGSLGAAIGSGRLTPAPCNPTSAPPPVNNALPRSKGALPLALTVFTLSLLSPAIPALVFDRATSTASHANGPTAPPADPEFSYEVPGDLESAHAAQWRIVASRSVPGLHQSSVAAQSGSGRILAYGDSGSGGLTVFDRTKGRIERTFSTPPVASMAWSPTEDRIFCVSALDGSCWVLNRATGETMHLPVRGLLPRGLPEWRSGSEIRFLQGTSQTGRLDLDLLRYSSLPSGEGDRSDNGTLPSSSLAETDKCRISIRPRIHSLGSPVETGSGSWNFDGSATLCVVDKSSNCVFPLLHQQIETGTKILSSPDGSMITLVTPQGAMTHYVGISAESFPNTFEVELPALPEHPPDSRLANLSESGRIGVFVCRPLLNPLTGKVIGPDPRQVRALAFCSEWDEDGGKLTIAESYAPVQAGDIAGYLHHWRAGIPALLSGAKLEEWWKPANSPSSKVESSITPSLPWQDAKLVVTPGGIDFTGWKQGQNDPSHPPVMDVHALMAGKPRPQVTVPPPTPQEEPGTPPPPPIQAPAPNNLVAVVQRFVSQHHAKVGGGDLEGFVGDYADTVDFHDKGLVQADFIRKDQAAYLPKYDNLSETVVGPIQVTPIKGGWRANYTLRSFAISKRDGKEHDTRVAMTLDIYHHHGGDFEIFRERAVPAN